MELGRDLLAPLEAREYRWYRRYRAKLRWYRGFSEHLYWLYRLYRLYCGDATGGGRGFDPGDGYLNGAAATGDYAVEDGVPNGEGGDAPWPTTRPGRRFPIS